MVVIECLIDMERSPMMMVSTKEGRESGCGPAIEGPLTQSTRSKPSVETWTNYHDEKTMNIFLDDEKAAA